MRCLPVVSEATKTFPTSFSLIARRCPSLYSHDTEFNSHYGHQKTIQASFTASLSPSSTTCFPLFLSVITFRFHMSSLQYNGTEEKRTVSWAWRFEDINDVEGFAPPSSSSTWFSAGDCGAYSLPSPGRHNYQLPSSWCCLPTNLFWVCRGFASPSFCPHKFLAPSLLCAMSSCSISFYFMITVPQMIEPFVVNTDSILSSSFSGTSFRDKPWKVWAPLDRNANWISEHVSRTVLIRFLKCFNITLINPLLYQSSQYGIRLSWVKCFLEVHERRHRGYTYIPFHTPAAGLERKCNSLYCNIFGIHCKANSL